MEPTDVEDQLYYRIWYKRLENLQTLVSARSPGTNYLEGPLYIIQNKNVVRMQVWGTFGHREAWQEFVFCIVSRTLSSLENVWVLVLTLKTENSRPFFLFTNLHEKETLVKKQKEWLSLCLAKIWYLLLKFQKLV